MRCSSPRRPAWPPSTPGALTWTQAWVHMQTFLRANLLTAQLASGGPEAGQPVGSAGEAITHFRDDTEDIAMFVDGMLDVSAGLVFTMLAGFVLGRANAGRRRRAAAAAGRDRARDQTARLADQGVPVGRPRGDRRRSPGWSATSWRPPPRSRSTTPPTRARAAAAARRPAPTYRGARPRARRGRAGVQPGRRRRRARPGAAGLRRGARIGTVRRRRPGAVHRLPGVAQLPAADDRAAAGAAQAGRRGLRPAPPPRGRSRRSTTRCSPATCRSSSAHRHAPRDRAPGTGRRCSASTWSRRRRSTPRAPAS